MDKVDLLAKLLVKYGDIKKYVTLVDDKYIGRHVKYTFCNGYPENYNKLPAWANELEAGNIYIINNDGMSDHLMIEGSTPVDVNKLMEEKYELSANDIFELIK